MRNRIFWLMMLVTLTVVLSFVVPLALLVKELAADRAISTADQAARNFAMLLPQLKTSRQTETLLAQVNHLGAPQLSVLTVSGKYLGARISAAELAEMSKAKTGQAIKIQTSTTGRVLLPVVLPKGVAVIRSATEPGALTKGVAKAWSIIAGLGIGMLGLAAIAALKLGSTVSRPVLEVAAVAHRIRAGDLTARAEISGPKETKELALALNLATHRVSELLQDERAAVADLSHRLRTPLTALRLDIDSVQDPDLHQRMSGHIANLQRSVDAVVQEARRPVRTAIPTGCDAVQVITSRVRFWSVLAEDQGRDLNLTLPESPALIPLAENDFLDLLDVLIDNVFTHTPEGVGFQIRLVATPRAVELWVTDPGPAAPVAAFGNTGLGLEIASRLVKSVAGEIKTDFSNGGLVWLKLPRLDNI